MKHARINGILSRAAAVFALSVGASAQLVNREAGALASRQIRTGSLENDMREQKLTLAFKMRPRAGTDPLAIMPLDEEMIRTLELSNGTPGGVAVIHLDTRELELRTGGAGRVQIAGLFDDDGLFSYELPQDVDVRGLFAAGEDVASIAGHELLKKSAGGAAVPARKRPEMDVETIPTRRNDGRFQGKDVVNIAAHELVKKSAGGAAVPARKRPEMDVETIPTRHNDGRFQGKDVVNIAAHELVKKSAGGAAVPARKRPEMDLERDAIDLGEQSEGAYTKWWTIWTSLQLGKDHRMQTR